MIGLRVSPNESVALESAQRLREHLLAHALDDAAKFAPAARSLAESATG